jgi:hypothetical protein
LEKGFEGGEAILVESHGGVRHGGEEAEKVEL